MLKDKIIYMWFYEDINRYKVWCSSYMKIHDLMDEDELRDRLNSRVYDLTDDLMTFDIE